MSCGCDCSKCDCGDVVECTACGQAMTLEEHFGTEANGEKNCDYCAGCYIDGKLVEVEKRD